MIPLTVWFSSLDISSCTTRHRVRHSLGKSVASWLVMRRHGFVWSVKGQQVNSFRQWFPAHHCPGVRRADVPVGLGALLYALYALPQHLHAILPLVVVWLRASTAATAAYVSSRRQHLTSSLPAVHPHTSVHPGLLPLPPARAGLIDFYRPYRPVIAARSGPSAAAHLRCSFSAYFSSKLSFEGVTSRASRVAEKHRKA